ncbi:MAG: hypothetical protein K0S41_2057 [Anaerocolumna sp.]|jgi:hypothetical protein|nr:hypothetical protein [Anaerocolumna sp.]
MSENQKSLSLNFNAKFTPIEKLNEQFTLCKCYVMALGKNRNFSHFSKENVLRNIDSLNYIPVVGHLIEKEDGSLYVGSHDVEFLIENNELKIKSLTVPFGVVVENSYGFEDITESDGTTATYLIANVILWTERYPDLMSAIYNESIYFGQSMEIDFNKWKQLDEDKNYTDIIDFVFSALTLLGKSDNLEFHTEPCFPSSRLEPYTNNFNQTEFSKVMGELKEQLSFYFNKEGIKEGGNALKDEIRDAILQEFNLALGDLNFEITEELTEETFRSKLEEFKSNNEKPITLFSATYRQKRDALSNALVNDTVYDASGNVVEETYYWVEDFDDSFVYVEKSHWTENDYNTNYGRYIYVFDETNLTATISGEFEEMVKVWLTVEENQALQVERASYELAKNEFDQYKLDYSTPNTEVERLVKFERDSLDNQRNLDEITVFEKFEERIGNTTEFSELKTNAKNFSIEALEKECIYIVGLHTEYTKEPKKQENLKFSVEKKTDEQKDAYGDLFKKFKKD